MEERSSHFETRFPEEEQTHAPCAPRLALLEEHTLDVKIEEETQQQRG
jgi:hypothetical protein